MKNTLRYRFCNHTVKTDAELRDTLNYNAETGTLRRAYCPACRAKKQGQSAALDAHFGANNHIAQDLS